MYHQTRPSPFSGHMDTAENKLALDNACRKLLSNRMILAWIMKCTMKEYRNYNPQVIAAQFIEGEPSLMQTAVHQDSQVFKSDHIPTAGSIQGDDTMDKSINEGTIAYDIRFRAILPNNEETITFIINIEAQGNHHPGYPLVTRGIYYGGRLISAQYGTEFLDSHYEKIKKVYSIWICIHPPQYRSHSINKYELAETVIKGSYQEPPEHYDLLTIIMLCLGSPAKEKPHSLEDQVIDLLSVLFSKELDTNTKKLYLENTYHIPMTAEIEKEAESMCNYGDYIEEKGIQKGLQTGIQAFIVSCKELDVSKDVVFDKLLSNFHLESEAAKKYMADYWS